MPRADLDDRWRGGTAGVEHQVAAVGKRATGWHVDEFGHAAGDGRQPCAPRQAQPGARGEQAPRVRVGQPLEDCGRGAAFDHRAGVHHHQLLHAVGHHAQVVADQQQPHAVFAHQFLDQVQHLALDGDVQRRRGFVGDQQVGPAGQRDGNHHTLALAAGELVRVGIQPLRGLGQLHPLQQAQRLGAGGRARHAAVQAQRFGDLPAHGVQRVEGGHRLLEDHADAVAAQLAVVGFGQRGQFVTFEAHRAAHLRALGQQPHDGQCRDGLAAARFADQAQRLPARQLEADPAQRVGRAARGVQRDMQVGDFEQAQGRGDRPAIVQKACRDDIASAKSTVRWPAGRLRAQRSTRGGTPASRRCSGRATLG
jgi:hypothetical protein